MKKLFLALSVLALVGAGCAGGETGGVNYVSTNTVVDKSEGFASAWFTAEGLAANSVECGTDHNAAYYQAFVDGLGDASSLNYTFTAEGDNQDPQSWYVTAVPNVTNYTSMKAFADDFNVCAAGGQTYPLMLNADWLVFKSSCGSGYSDGTNRLVGCDVAQRNTTLSMTPPPFADDRVQP